MTAFDLLDDLDDDPFDPRPGIDLDGATTAAHEAEHLRMSLRGHQTTGSRTTTSALRGTLRDDPRSRQELFALVRSD